MSLTNKRYLKYRPPRQHLIIKVCLLNDRCISRLVQRPTVEFSVDLQTEMDRDRCRSAIGGEQRLSVDDVLTSMQSYAATDVSDCSLLWPPLSVRIRFHMMRSLLFSAFPLLAPVSYADTCLVLPGGITPGQAEWQPRQRFSQVIAARPFPVSEVRRKPLLQCSETDRTVDNTRDCVLRMSVSTLAPVTVVPRSHGVVIRRNYSRRVRFTPARTCCPLVCEVSSTSQDQHAIIWCRLSIRSSCFLQTFDGERLTGFILF